MKNNFILLVINFLITLGVQAQTTSDKVNLTWGEEQTLGRKYVFDDIIGIDASGSFILKKVYSNKTPIMIEKYDHKMKLVQSALSDLGDKSRRRYYKYATQIDGQLIIFSVLNDKNTKTKILFAQTVNKKTLKLSPKLTNIGTINYGGSKRGYTGSFSFNVSKDDKRILIYYSLPFKKGENQKLSFHIYDKDLNSVWKKAITMPYEDELFQVKSHQIQDNGDMYLLTKIFQEKPKDRIKGKPNYHYQIFAYSNKGKSVKEYPIVLKDKFLSEMNITINNQGDIICAGFYSNYSSNSLDGSYFLKIDSESKNIVSKNFKEFGLDFITQNMTDKQKKKTEKRDEKGQDAELYKYELDQIILREDGGAILVGEQYYVRVTTTTTSEGATRTVTHYYYNDILVISINPKGEIDWTEKIAKRQHTTDDGGFYSSYVVSVVGDRINFIFNDNIKNLATAKMTKGKEKGIVYNFTSRFKSSVAVLVQVDADGRQVKEALFNAKEAELLIRPKVCEQISDNEVVIYGKKRKTERVGKVTFK